MKNKIIVCSVVVALCSITMAGVAGEEDRVTMVHYKADGTVVRTSFDPSVRPCDSHRHNQCSSESAISITHTRASCQTTHVWQAPPPAPVQPIVVQPVVVQQPVYVEQPVYYEEPRTVYWNGPGIVAGASFSVNLYGYGGGYSGYRYPSYWRVNNSCNERYDYRNTQHNYGVGGHHGGRRR